MIHVQNVSKTFVLHQQNGVRLPVLQNASLEVGNGECVVLHGHSGSGKSTIARLIASLWDVKDGEIDLGGVDIRTLPLAECTKRIAYVSQDNYLFDLSVMDNIRMGRKGATDAEVIDAAKKCGCHEFIMGLENGYQTVCGASGGHLSGGERQRVAICRALINDPSIIFADEPTGNLDSKSGKVVAEEFRKINEELGKTLLMVTHDPQMASRCKRVIFLKDGYVMNDVRKEGTEEEFYRTIIGEMEKF